MNDSARSMLHDLFRALDELTEVTGQMWDGKDVDDKRIAKAIHVARALLVRVAKTQKEMEW